MCTWNQLGGKKEARREGKKDKYGPRSSKMKN